jgi:GNAT superfamily N-acetyltransferase
MAREGNHFEPASRVLCRRPDHRERPPGPLGLVCSSRIGALVRRNAAVSPAREDRGGSVRNVTSEPRHERITIRDYESGDRDAVVELSLRAWSPVFRSVNDILGPELATLLHGADWRAYQASDVRATLSSASNRAWIAEIGDEIVGFASATIIDQERRLGEITMVAVDPSAQENGVGGAVTEHATAWLRDRGMLVAMIATGADPGHAPARRVYERLGFRQLPSAQYFRAL